MYSGVDPRVGGVSGVATQPLVLGMDTYAAPLMQFAHVQFLKFTPHLVWDTSGYTGTGNDHSGFGPMHYHMHLNRSVMYYRHVEACLGDRDVPKLEKSRTTPPPIVSAFIIIFIGCALPGVEAIISLANCLFSYTCTE